MNRIQKPSFADAFVHHSTGELRKPVMKRAEQGEERPADQDVMKMRDDKKRIVHLKIERNRRQHHARQSAQHEDEDKPAHEMHCGVSAVAAGPQSRQPAEDLNAACNRDHHAGGGEVRFADLRQPCREHVMHPQAQMR